MSASNGDCYFIFIALMPLISTVIVNIAALCHRKCSSLCVPVTRTTLPVPNVLSPKREWEPYQGALILSERS